MRPYGCNLFPAKISFHILTSLCLMTQKAKGCFFLKKDHMQRLNGDDIIFYGISDQLSIIIQTEFHKNVGFVCLYSFDTDR
jgi:hypothetical protein